MPVNENKIVINLKGSFKQDSFRGLLKDFLSTGLESILDGRPLSVEGKSFNGAHKQITVGYDGARVDQLRLDGIFQTATLALPALASAKAIREASTTIDTTTYTIQAAF